MQIEYNSLPLINGAVVTDGEHVGSVCGIFANGVLSLGSQYGDSSEKLIRDWAGIPVNIKVDDTTVLHVPDYSWDFVHDNSATRSEYTYDVTMRVYLGNHVTSCRVSPVLTRVHRRQMMDVCKWVLGGTFDLIMFDNYFDGCVETTDGRVLGAFRGDDHDFALLQLSTGAEYVRTIL